MAEITDEVQEKMLEEAYSVTPNYDIDSNDPRFGKVDDDEAVALTENKQLYDGMIAQSDSFYEKQIEASQDWADEQSRLQQERTDFTIEQIEQQKDQAHKDYLKEQSGAYVDWQKQSNKFGVEAERQASAGLTGTGYSESSQVSMYNTYQNRVATAKESYNRAVLNYNNAINEARMQNDEALAQIAYEALEKQLSLSLEGFQYKNSLIIEQANRAFEIDNVYYNRYQDVLDQINHENAMAEEIRQYNETQKWQTEQNERNRQFQAEQAEIDRKFEADQAELNRKHDKEMLEAETEAEKELIAERHKNDLEKLQKQHDYDMQQLNQQYANEKSLASYKSSLSSSGGGGSSGGYRISGGSGSGNSAQISSTGNKTAERTLTPARMGVGQRFGVTSYKRAVSVLTQLGVPKSKASAAMTESEWSRRRTAYKSTGKGSTEVTKYDTYSEYIQAYVDYCYANYT